MQTIRLIDDDKFGRPDLKKWPYKPGDIWTLNITDKSDFQSEITITPHYGENEVNTELFRLRLYCERNNIKIIAKGSLNQLPLLSQIADRVILDGKSSLEHMYRAGSHYRLREPNHKVKQNIWNESKQITNSEVIQRFASSMMCIRRSSYEFFLNQNFPCDLVVAEIRIANSQQKRLIKKIATLEITGLNYEFQIPLVQKSQHHYMSVQVLGSLLNQWSFICGGGSSNLFCLLPVKWLLLTEVKTMFTESTRQIIRGLAQARYGNIGDKVPIIDTSTYWTHHLKLNQTQWKMMEAAHYEISFAKCEPENGIMVFHEEGGQKLLPNQIKLL